MKIALVHYTASPVVGGVESVLEAHARLMADAGHQVQVIAGRGEQVDGRIPFREVPLVDSRHLRVLAAKAALDGGLVPPAFEILASQLAEQLDRLLGGTEIVIAHNVCSLHKNLPLTAALHTLSQAHGAPGFILWHHDLAWLAPRYQPELHPGYPWDLLGHAWEGVLQVTVSEQRQQELAGLFEIPPQQIAVAPNGLDARRFYRLEAQTQEIYERLELSTAQPLLLLPVRVTPRKNIELALRALAALRLSFPQAALLVTGPLGPHNPENQRYLDRLFALRRELSLEQAAIFLAEQVDGYLPHPVIADFFRLADALLFPSFEEGFGIPILEAGLARLPVFCSDIPPLRELAGEQAVYFSPEEQPERVASLIGTRLSADPAFVLHSKVRATYTWERIYTERIEPLLRGIWRPVNEKEIFLSHLSEDPGPGGMGM